MSKNTPERHDVYCDKQYPMIKKIVCNVLEYKNRGAKMKIKVGQIYKHADKFMKERSE